MTDEVIAGLNTIPFICRSVYHLMYNFLLLQRYICQWANIFRPNPYFVLFGHLKASPWITATRVPHFPQISPLLNPVARVQVADLSPSTGCVGDSWHNGLTWNVAEAGLCRLPAQCKQQGEMTELLWNTPPVKLSLKGKHLLPRESLYFTLPLGSTLDLTADCSGVKLEKSTSSPHVTIK